MHFEFENLPNFRQAGGHPTVEGLSVNDGMIYRSSRTDFVTKRDVSRFRELGIKSIIDLRGKTEFKTANGNKLLNPLYAPYTVKNGVMRRLKLSSCLGGRDSVDDEDDELLGRRYLVSMASAKLIWHLFYQLNAFIRWFTLLIAFFDWVVGTHYFVKLCNHMVLNEQSLAGRYIEVLEYNKDAVRDCVRIMSNRENMPVLIHCAHGKDRTGLLVAVVLGSIGVSDEDIITDYGLSEVRKYVLYYVRNLFIIYSM